MAALAAVTHGRRGLAVACVHRHSDRVYRICNDDTGETIEVSPDGDGLDLTEICFRESGGKITDRIVFSEEALPLLIEALQRRWADVSKT